MGFSALVAGAAPEPAAAGEEEDEAAEEDGEARKRAEAAAKGSLDAARVEGVAETSTADESCSAVSGVGSAELSAFSISFSAPSAATQPSQSRNTARAHDFRERLRVQAEAQDLSSDVNNQ